MHTFVKNTCAIHNLALATAFGGPLFAKLGLKKAVLRDIDDEKQRGRVLATAWNRYSRIYVPAHVAFTVTWLIERKIISKIHPDHRLQRLVAFKDVLIAGALLTGIANVIAGRRMNRDFPEGVPVSAKATTDPKLLKYRRFFRVMGPANLVFVGASIAVAPAIGFGILRSRRRNLIKRLFSH
jgi:hypothetical protein